MKNIDNHENKEEDTNGLDEIEIQNILSQKTPLEKEVEDLIHLILEKDRLILAELCRELEKLDSGQAESFGG